MYKRFEVKNFRCFPELSAGNLERFNLIAGVNNVGKTSLLEAIFVHCGAGNPELTLRLDAFRGIEEIRVHFVAWKETVWDSLFNEFDTGKIIELDGKDGEGLRRITRLRVLREPEDLPPSGELSQPNVDKPEAVALSSEAAQVLELEYEENGRKRKHHMILDRKGIRVAPIVPGPPFQTIFLPARVRISTADDSERFGNLEKLGQQDAVVKALQVIEPRLERLAVVVDRRVPMIQGNIGLSRLVPLPVMGEGMARLTSLVLAIGNSPNGLVLLDEIENGLHHTVLAKVWKAIAEVARRFNTQIFATTHSLECIMAAYRSFSESDKDDFRLHRLNRVNGTIKWLTYDAETLKAAIETGLEVR
jgi:hypothetical protein